jgi:hypothetical protein
MQQGEGGLHLLSPHGCQVSVCRTFFKLLSMLADNFTIASYEVLAGTLVKLGVLRDCYTVPT